MLRPDAIKKGGNQSDEEVRSCLHEMWAAYEEKDLSVVLKRFWSGPELVSIGTGRDEFSIGSDMCSKFLRRDFEQSHKMHIDAEIVSLEIEGNLAWAASKIKAKVDLPNDHCFAIEGRCTNVLKKSESGWQIVQQHFSAPLPNQEVGQSFSTN